ncbi:alpha-glucan family phosphorylase [Rhodocyclus gracilis]|uniref:glycogen phosphorylase n=1 Tax=Rhodocyclus tenuis TaxID=1066 RepID=A0A6L5JTJ7_RHOTE|nr:alpha-glucan family phosphorylase [Rhodocyclus gracilis]MQY50549.1 alpha-glucan family phosphorylase [Rhodocyclus gracilis]
MPGTVYTLEVNPRIPPRLQRLSELANDLWYSWDRPTRALFARLQPTLWLAVGHNPKAFLKRIDQKRLDAAAEDPTFIGSFNRVLSAYDTYLDIAADTATRHGFHSDDIIAYFCAEFGLHESLPIYSGGLGILAGDHCKAASDMGLPFVGVGLLYRQGYFIQTLDADGRQHANYHDTDFGDLPATPVQDEQGREIRVAVDLPGRQVQARVWEVRVGRVHLLLLDTSLPENSEHDRDIAHRLYGGDIQTRLEQEILLGVGGVRALAAVGIAPTVWHINEGHAAFLILERIRQLCQQGLSFPVALEAVAANVVFTTHTPVPAGHDHFSEEAITRHFAQWCADVGATPAQLLALGETVGEREFNMTTLAIRGSRLHNGVSRIHGDVSSHICANLWPQIEPAENPLSYVTNGVHTRTFLATEWFETFDRYLGVGWEERQTDAASWAKVEQIPDTTFWGIRQMLKSQLLHMVRHRVSTQHARNEDSPSRLDRLLRLADPNKPNVLTIGFARRFATYKRGALLFHDLERLAKIIANSERPVLFLFAGKAHPADQPGQELIRRIAQIARLPQFEGHILLLEDYDLHLSRRLVAGVDVWLNNPIYPLEASGTSGMKAAMNGVLNVSILDGWWGEGFDNQNGIPNGWSIKPAPGHLDETRRDDEEANSLYEILENQVIPTYYRVGPAGLSTDWVGMAKRAISSITPHFNVNRMVGEYVHNFYLPAAAQGRRYSAEHFATAHAIADWKARVRAAWPGVALRRVDTPPLRLGFGDSLRLEVMVRLNGLPAEDIVVEAVFARPSSSGKSKKGRHAILLPVGDAEHGEQRYALDLTPEHCGKLEYRLRAYPAHAQLTHRFEMGMMLWL